MRQPTLATSVVKVISFLGLGTTEKLFTLFITSCKFSVKEWILVHLHWTALEVVVAAGWDSLQTPWLWNKLSNKLQLQMHKNCFQ